MTPDAGDRPGTDGAARSEPDEPQQEQAPDEQADDELVDEMSEESFPGSDPPSTWAGGRTT